MLIKQDPKEPMCEGTETETKEKYSLREILEPEYWMYNYVYTMTVGL